MSPHLRALLQALLVTFLWSTSWVIIKVGLQDIPPLTFAGLRYSAAFLCLLPLLFHTQRRATIKHLSRREWISLAALGLVFYTTTQGTQFLALATLPALTLSLLLNFTTIVVALLGWVLLAERLTRLQWLGIGVFLIGVLVYFYPVVIPLEQTAGLVFGVVSLLANAVSSIMGRHINQREHLPPLVVTGISMGVGAFALLAAGLVVEDIPTLTPANVAAILWLAVVNTAFAFTLWNRTLRTLTAAESSLIANSMLIQIGLLAWVFLGEAISLREGFGMTIAAIGIVVVQWFRAERKSEGAGLRPAPQTSD